MCKVFSVAVFLFLPRPKIFAKVFGKWFTDGQLERHLYLINLKQSVNLPRKKRKVHSRKTEKRSLVK